MLNGGYIMVSKTDTDLYKKLNNALTLGKPVLFYENDTTCYYIDTISLDGTDIVLTKGGKTITIEADGDITETGDIQNHLYMYYSNYFDITTTDSDYQEIYLTFTIYSEKDLSELINKLNTNATYNDLVDFINEFKQIDFVASQDSVYSGCVITDVSGISVCLNGGQLTLTSNEITNLDIDLKFKQLF